MEMVAAGLKKNLQVAERVHLLSLYRNICTADNFKTAAEALSLVRSQMASSQHVEVEATKLLHKLIQESKDEPAKLATKLYVICKHMKLSGGDLWWHLSGVRLVLHELPRSWLRNN